MLNNDVLRRVRYILNFNDKKMVQVFEHTKLKVTQEKIVDWLRKDDDSCFKKCDDVELACFLNGLIVERRGSKDGEVPEAEKKLSNNQVFRKLMIAFTLKSDDVVELLDSAGFKIGKHELSAFFRKPGHKNYRDCKDQILRNFLSGLQLKFRSEQA